MIQTVSYLFGKILRYFFKLSKWFIITIFSIIILWFGISLFKEKWNEYHFYEDPSHHKWARTLKTKPIDFWTYPWKGINEHIGYLNGDAKTPIFRSPQKKNLFFYFYPDKEKMPYSRDTLVYNVLSNSSQVIDGVHHEDDVKWVFDEQYVIYLKYEDIFLRDVIPFVYIYNLKTGKYIKLAESIKPEFSSKYKM